MRQPSDAISRPNRRCPHRHRIPCATHRRAAASARTGRAAQLYQPLREL